MMCTSYQITVNVIFCIHWLLHASQIVTQFSTNSKQTDDEASEYKEINDDEERNLYDSGYFKSSSLLNKILTKHPQKTMSNLIFLASWISLKNFILK